MRESQVMTKAINYRIEDVVLVKDLKQAKLYALHGCHLADVLFSKKENIFVHDCSLANDPVLLIGEGTTVIKREETCRTLCPTLINGK